MNIHAENMPEAGVMGGDYEWQLSEPGSPVYTLPNMGECYSSGRAALYHILMSIADGYSASTRQRIFIPQYICHAVPDTAARTGMEICRYPLTVNMEPQLDYTQLRADDILLIVNYFGLMNTCSMIESIHRAAPTVTVIEDDVQALYVYLKGAGAEFAFTSLRKWFAVPDGGAARPSSRLTSADAECHYATLKLAGMKLKQHRRADGTDDERYLQLLRQGEVGINADIHSRMSDAALETLRHIDIRSAARLRRRNAEYLYEGLYHAGITPLLPLVDDVVPLFVPILLEKRDLMRRRLFSRNIFCPVHWPECTDFSPANHELSLIIDQRYSIADMQRQLRILTE